MANPPPSVSPPDPPWSVNRLGERIERMLQRAAIGVLNAAKDTLARVLAFGGEVFLDALEQAVAPRAAPVIDEILETPDLPAWFTTYLQHLRNPTSQADAVGLGGLASGAGMQASSAALAPLMRKINYAIDRKSQSARPDPAVAWPMAWRHPESERTLCPRCRTWDGRRRSSTSGRMC